MNEKITKFVNETENKTLINFMYHLAQQMNTYLKEYPEIHHKIELALEDIIKWPNKKAKELYEHLHPIDMLENFEIDTKENKAFFSILSALYYIIWDIDNIERPESYIAIASDMADVSRHTALESIYFAIKVLNGVEEIQTWIDNPKDNVIGNKNSTYLTINYALPYTTAADTLRSFWQVLSKPTSDSFQLTGLPQNIFLAADQAQEGTAIRFELAYQKNSFPIEFKVNPLEEQGFLVSLLFLNPDQTDQLLGNPIGNVFLKWVLGRLHIGGKMLGAEVAFFAQETAPNAYVKLVLKENLFTLEQYPLFCWTPRTKVSNDFLKEAGFTSMINKNNGSELLLPEEIYDSIFG